MGTWKHLLFFTSMVKYLAIKSVFCGDSASEWSYSDISDWRNKMPQCGGTRQSPVDINDNEAITVKKHTELHFNDYNTSINVVLKNNGKTVKMDPVSAHNVTVEAQGIYLQGKFTLEEVHFHWGNTMSMGSEHKVNGKSSSMEVHLVHYNLKYLDFKTARNKHNGILVLSVLVEVSSTRSSFNSIWKDIVYKLAVVKNPDTETNYGSLWFQHFLPKNVRDFYSYQGSFTTPPCLETVTWVVFKDKLLIPEEYLIYFTDLQTAVNKTLKERITSNIRPAQPLNSRIVLKTFNSTEPQQLGVQIYTTERIVGDNKVIVFFKFYQCHLPLSASIFLIIPSLDISWKRSNLTSDLENIEILDPKYEYGVTLEMHNHPRGMYKDNIHVTVKLTDSPKHHPLAIDNKFKMDRKCFDESCSWLTSGIKRTCTRQLIGTDDTLSFTLTLQDPCSKLYNLVIEKQNHVIFNTTISRNMRVHLQPVGVDKALNITLSKWHLVLYVGKASDHNNNSTKLFFSMPHSVINYKTLVMEGNYKDNWKCTKRVLAQSGDTADHVKFIVGIGVGVFILAMIVITVALLRKRYRANTKPSLLTSETEQDTVV